MSQTVDLREVLEKVFRRLERRWHPDTGGSKEGFQALNDAITEMRRDLETALGPDWFSQRGAGVAGDGPASFGVLWPDEPGDWEKATEERLARWAASVRHEAAKRRLTGSADQPKEAAP
jgi:hypothetical protein